jgi:hypothetical protein
MLEAVKREVIMPPRAVLREVSYEIHRRSEESEWEIAGIYFDAPTAIHDAKRIFEEMADAFSVRVVRDVYDPETNTSRVNTVFRATQQIPEDAAQGYWDRRHAGRRRPGAGPAGSPLADELMGGLLSKMLPAAMIENLAPRPNVTRGIAIAILASMGFVIGTVAGLLY